MKNALIIENVGLIMLKKKEEDLLAGKHVGRTTDTLEFAKFWSAFANKNRCNSKSVKT